MSHHDDIAPNPNQDTGSGEERGRRDEAAPEINIPADIGRPRVAERLLDASQRGDDSAVDLGPLPDSPLHDMDHGLPSALDDSRIQLHQHRAPGSSALDSPQDDLHHHRRTEASNDGTNTAILENTTTTTWSNANTTRRSVSSNDQLDFGFGQGRIPSRHSTDAENTFDFGRGQIPDTHSTNSDHGLPFGHENRLLDFAPPPRDENPFSDRFNNSGNERENPNDIWNMAMADDEDALDRLLAAREEDEAAPILNTSTGSFFDEDEAHNLLLDELIPRAPRAPADFSDEPRRMTEEELRRYLPEEQELYRLTDFFDEALHMALPYDPEFDCSCSFERLTAPYEGRRKRCASEPLPGPPKRCCPRIPDLNLLTLNARRPRNNYLPFAPLCDRAEPHNASQASIHSIPVDSMENRADVVSTSSINTAIAVYSTNDLTTPMDTSMDGSQNSSRSSSSFASLVKSSTDDLTTPIDDSTDGIQIATRSSSSSVSLMATARSDSTMSVDDLQTAREATPPPPVPLNGAQMPLLAVPAPAPVPLLNAAVAQQAQVLENDIQTALVSIAERLKLISSPQYRCSKNTLDFVTRLQRSRSTMRRLQKELDEANLGIGRKTHDQIEDAYETNERKLLKLLSEITRAA